MKFLLNWTGNSILHTPLVLVFIDIERVEQLKESLDIAEIDLLYVLLSSRIKDAFFHFDTLARWSENRFALLLENNANALDLKIIMNKLQGLVSIIQQPFSIINKEISVSCHIGVCIFDDDFNTCHDLILNTEIASAQAKRDGGNCCRFNSSELNSLAAEKSMMANSLRMALKCEQLQLFYQPVCSPANALTNGAEALLRWKLENGVQVSPEKIIRLAEELGLMVQLGYWILNCAIKDASKIVKKTNKPFKIAINLAPVQLTEIDFVSSVQAILKMHQFAASDLILEITETQLMNDMDICIHNLKKLRALNIGIAIDDFGTGHSSLEYLSQLPISTLKIDRSFVRKIEGSESDRAIIKMIIGLAHSLSLNIIAEGVENIQQLTFICEHLRNDEEVQGYYFSRPLPLEQLLLFIKDKTPIPTLIKNVSKPFPNNN